MAEMKIPVAGIIGAGSGISLGIFVSEFVSRVTGMTGWAKFGVKAVVKLALFAVLKMLSDKILGNSILSFGVEMASYGTAGSIIPDAVDALVPGGLIGLSEMIAVSVRSLRPVVRQVSDEQRMRKELSEQAMRKVAPEGLL